MQLKIEWRNGWAYVRGTDPNGKRIQRSLRTNSPRKAEELRASLERDLWNEHVYGASSVITFDQAALAYAKDGGDTRYLIKVTTLLEGAKLKEINSQTVRETAKKAYPNVANATINRQGITPIRAVINYAAEQGWCPPIRIKSYEVKKKKRKAVKFDYILALEPHVPPHMFTLLLFLNTTGRRVGEAVKLTYEDIDFEKGTATLLDTKNGEDAIAFLAPLVLERMKKITPRSPKAPFFGYVHRSSIYDTLKRACNKAGVEYLGTHQVGRHSFATSLDQAGWTATQIANAGGWKSVRMVSEIYTHPTDAQTLAAQLIGEKLVRKTGEDSSND